MRNNSNQSTNNNNNNKNNLNEEQPDRQKHCRCGHMIPHCSHNINNECFAALLLLHFVVAKKLVMRVIHKVFVCVRMLRTFELKLYSIETIKIKK